MSIEVEYCRDRRHLTTHVLTPRHCCLSETSPRCLVNYATTGQLDDMRRIVQLAAERGDNVGMDEYASGSSRSKHLYNRSEIFVVTTIRNEPRTEAILKDIEVNIQGQSNPTDTVAFIAINAGGYDSCLASICVFRAPSLASDDAAFRALVGLGVQLADEINCGYTHAMIDVALCHSNLLHQMKAEGFTVTAIVAHAVNIVGVGSCQNVIFVKRFRPDRPARSLAAVLEMLERTEPCTEFMAQYPAMSLPQIQFLPQRYTFSCGVDAIYRNIRKDEDEKLYQMFMECIRRGEGYGSTYYASLDYFRMHVVASGPFVVVEDHRTGEIIGFSHVGVAPFLRGGQAAFTNRTVFNPSYRGRGILAEHTRVLYRIAYRLGYRRGLEGTHIMNDRVKAMLRRPTNESRIIGIIPNVTYVQNGMGWGDMLLIDAEIQGAPTFLELIEENARKRNNSSKL